MLEVTFKSTELGKTEYKGQLMASVRHEWLLDGYPIHIGIAQTDYCVKGTKVEIYLGIFEPESPGDRRYKILSMDGYNIDAVGIVSPRRGMSTLEGITEVDTFYIDETKAQLDLFTICLPSSGFGTEEIHLRDYLEMRKDAEQPESAS